MSEAATIVRILPLKVLIAAIFHGQGEMRGRRPSRVVACSVQVDKWADEVMLSSNWHKYGLDKLTVLGVPVVTGASDCQPELMWALPIEDAE